MRELRSMPREPAALIRLARLRTDLAPDREALKARFAEAAKLLEELLRAGELSRADLVLLAVNLHGYYTALETALERIARLYDEELPSGPAWHRELVEQMRIAVPGLRDPVVPAHRVADLHELRRFRHFFRNAYVLDLDVARVREHAQRLVDVHSDIATSP